MTDRSHQFITSFNELDDALRKLTGTPREKTFSVVIDETITSKKLQHALGMKLKDISALRNAIVHDRSYPNRTIADPHEDIISELQNVVRMIDGTKTAIHISSPKPREFLETDPLRSALEEMKAKDYSQVAVRESGRLRLLTTDGITCWLESKFEEELLLLDQVTIADALAFEKSNRFRIVPRSLSVAEVSAIFEYAATQSDERLFALLVTQNGRENEKCIGIVTPSDSIAA